MTAERTRSENPVTLVHTEKQKESTWEKPLPFDECTLPEFPVDALPKVIADYVTALAESTQTPGGHGCFVSISNYLGLHSGQIQGLRKS